MTLDLYHSNWLVFRRVLWLHTLSLWFELPYLPWYCVFSTLSHVFWITHTSPGVAYSLHFQLCFELPILPLVLRIFYIFTCVLNYPYLTGFAYSVHFYMCFELRYPYFPWSCVFSILSLAFWVTHTSPGVVYLLPFWLWFLHTSLVWWSTHIFFVCWSTHTEIVSPFKSMKVINWVSKLMT